MAQRYRELAALFPGEVLVTSSASSTQRGALYVLDAAAASQTPLLHWKGAAHVAQHGFDATPSATHAKNDAGHSGWAAAVEADKAVLNVYHWQKDQPAQRIVLPQKMTCIALARRSALVAAGTDDGRLYVWDMRSGALVCSFEAHYRALRCLRFFDDDAALVSASDDGRACVWSTPGLARCTDLAGGRANVPTAYATLTDHTLPITDVHVAGRFPESAVVWTASADASVKLWDLRTRRLKSTFTLPGPVAALAIDPLERFFFASLHGTAKAYRVELYTNDPGAWHARGGRGAEGASDTIAAEHAHVLLAEPITALALTQAASHIALGTQNGQVHIVDVTTLQVVRVLHASASLAAAPNTPVTNILSMPRPPDLAGAAQLRAKKNRDETSPYVASLPARPVAQQFARTLAPPMDAPNVLVRIGDGAGTAARGVHTYLGAEAPVEAPHAAAAAPRPAADPAHAARVQQLEDELRRAKALNDEMWQHLVQANVAAHR